MIAPLEAAHRNRALNVDANQPPQSTAPQPRKRALLGLDAKPAPTFRRLGIVVDRGPPAFGTLNCPRHFFSSHSTHSARARAIPEIRTPRICAGSATPAEHGSGRAPLASPHRRQDSTQPTRTTVFFGVAAFFHRSGRRRFNCGGWAHIAARLCHFRRCSVCRDEFHYRVFEHRDSRIGSSTNIVQNMSARAAQLHLPSARYRSSKLYQTPQLRRIALRPVSLRRPPPEPGLRPTPPVPISDRRKLLSSSGAPAAFSAAWASRTAVSTISLSRCTADRSRAPKAFALPEKSSKTPSTSSSFTTGITTTDAIPICRQTSRFTRGSRSASSQRNGLPRTHALAGKSELGGKQRAQLRRVRSRTGAAQHVILAVAAQRNRRPVRARNVLRAVGQQLQRSVQIPLRHFGQRISAASRAGEVQSSQQGRIH